MSCWSRLRRTVTSEISAATNTPLSRMSAAMMSSSRKEFHQVPDDGSGRRSRGRAGTPTTVVPGGTSWVTTEPAPVTLPSPMVTGARMMVSEPMNAPSPMTVRCLRWPS